MKNFFKSTSIQLLFLVLFLLPASIAYASGGGEGGHDGKKWIEFFWKTLDFVVLVGFLYWMLAAKIKEFFIGRRQDVKESLSKAAEQKAEAERKFKE